MGLVFLAGADPLGFPVEITDDEDIMSNVDVMWDLSVFCETERLGVLRRCWEVWVRWEGVRDFAVRGVLVR